MIFLKGNFPSFKNSKQMTKGGYLIMSKTVRKYLKENEEQWEIIPADFQNIRESDYPLFIGMHFVRGTKHKYDWVNMVQGVQDLMVKHGWIADDNVEVMYPVPLEYDGVFSSYNKENPGVYIEILN